MKISKIITVGGWSLILFVVLYLGLQTLLRVWFDHPALLHGPGREMLPVMLLGGNSLAIVFTLLSLTPLLLIPGGIGAYYAFKEGNEPSMRLAMAFAVITAVVLVISLMRWPSINLYIANAYAIADESQRGLLNVMLLAFNNYLGVFLGGFLAVFSAVIWFFLTGLAMLRANKKSLRWIGWFGVVVAAHMLLDAIDNFGVFPAMISQLLNNLQPLDAVWVLVFGIGLLMHRKADF